MLVRKFILKVLAAAFSILLSVNSASADESDPAEANKIVAGDILNIYALADDPDYGQTYKIQAGDILEISVWNEPELNKPVLVRPDGRISFPLAGELIAGGKSIAQIQAELVERIQRYIPDPLVITTIKEIHGNKVFVIGEVNKPGEYLLYGDLNVMQVLSMAGGLQTFAKKDEVKILRYATDGELITIPFNFSRITRGLSLEQNVKLQTGDVIIVP